MPNLGTYGLDALGGGVGTAQNEALSVPGVGMPGGFGGDMQEFMKRALMEQYQRRKEEQARQLQAEQAARRQQEANRAMMMEDRNTDNRNSQIDRMNQQQQMNSARVHAGGGREAAFDPIRAQAEGIASEQMSLDRLPAATRMVHGPGIISGQTMDPMAMNAASRRAYLPDSSQITSDRTAGSAIGSQEFADIDRRNAFRRQSGLDSYARSQR